MIGLLDTNDESSKRKLYSLLKELKPGTYVYKLKLNRPVRSLSANSYYFAILKIIAIHTGYDQDELHETMKLKFNPVIVNFPKGGSQTIGKSTSDLDTKEFASYVNRVKRWAMDEFALVIPEAKDIDYIKMMEIENQYEKSVSGY